MPLADIFAIGGRAICLITRFNRGPRGRIPYVSAQTMLERDEATDGTYEEIAEALRATSSNPREQLAELFARIAFTILVSNVDDHLRNHGFVYAGRGHWGLSPAFDINRHRSASGGLRHGSPKDTGDEALIDTLLSKAATFGIGAQAADTVVATLASTVVARWRGEAEAAGMSRSDIKHYEPAFDHEDTRAALARGP